MISWKAPKSHSERHVNFFSLVNASGGLVGCWKLLGYRSHELGTIYQFFAFLFGLRSILKEIRYSIVTGIFQACVLNIRMIKSIG